MSRKFLGLDVRHDSISAVLVTSSLRDIHIEEFLQVPIPDAGGRDAGLRAALESIRASMEVDQASCIASIPADELSFRNLRVPFKGDRKIEQILPFEIEPTTPFPLEDLVLDFQTLPPTGHEGHTDLIAVAALKSTVESYLDIFSEVGFDPQTIIPGGYATAVCLSRFAAPPEDWILVDIGRYGDTLFFVKGGKIRLIRSYPTLSSENGGSALDAKIRQTLLAFENLSAQPIAPGHTFLTGAGLNGGGAQLQSALEKALDLPVSRVDLLQSASGKVKVDAEDAWHPGDMNNALAMTLAQIEGKNQLNFRRGPYAARRNWAAYRGLLIRLAAFAAVLFCLLGLDLFIEGHTLHRRVERIDREINTIFRSTFPEIQRIVDPVHQMKTAMDELRKETFIPGDANSRLLIIDILDEISRNIPGGIDVELTRMVVRQEDVLISGNTNTFNAVDDIQTHLEKSPMLQKVTINSTNKDQSENRVRFKMKVDL